jgi:hypothetical protein
MRIPLAVVVSFLVSGMIFFAFVENWSVLDAFYFSATTLTTVGLGAPDSPPAPDLLDATLRLVGVAVLPLLVSAAVLLPAFYVSAWLLAKRPQATRQPNSLNRLRSVLTANWLRTAWIGLAVLFFVMVVVPGALLIYHYSGIGD